MYWDRTPDKGGVKRESLKVQGEQQFMAERRKQKISENERVRQGDRKTLTY